MWKLQYRGHLKIKWQIILTSSSCYRKESSSPPPTWSMICWCMFKFAHHSTVLKQLFKVNVVCWSVLLLKLQQCLVCASSTLALFTLLPRDAVVRCSSFCFHTQQQNERSKVEALTHVDVVIRSEPCLLGNKNQEALDPNHVFYRHPTKTLMIKHCITSVFLLCAVERSVWKELT